MLSPATVDRGAGHPDGLRDAPAGVSGSVGFRRAALHLGGLWALAFAQPLLDLLGRNAQFFVAHGSTTGDILLLAFGYALVPPLVGAAIVWGLGRIRPALGWAAMLVLVALIVAALLLPPAGDVSGGSSVAVIAALALGAGAAALYARAAGVRSFVTVLSPAPLIVLFLFLVDLAGARPAVPERVRRLGGGTVALVDADRAHRARRAAADHARGRRRARSTPGCSRTSPGSRAQSTWYRNATTVDDLTTEAVPAQLTGEQPRRDSLPTARDHPRSLFTLFERSHELHGGRADHRPVPGAAVRQGPRRGRATGCDRSSPTSRSSSQQLLLPADLREGLPAIDRVWEGFETGSATVPGELRGGSQPDARRAGAARARRRDGRVRSGRSPRWTGRRRGRRCSSSTRRSRTARGASCPTAGSIRSRASSTRGSRSGSWVGPQWQVDQSFQRHVLQVQYADRLVGELLDALRARGLFDRAVIVVTADHGDVVPDRPAAPPGERREHRGDRARPVLRQAAGPARGTRRRRRGADDRRAADDRQGGRSEAAVEGRRDARRRARGRPGRADRRLARRRARADGAARLGAGEAPRARGRRGAAAARRALRDRAAAGAARAARRGAARAARRVTVDDQAAVLPAFMSGRVDGLEPGAEVAVAVNGRVEATTRVYRDGRPLALRGARAAVVAARRAERRSACSRCCRAAGCGLPG